MRVIRAVHTPLLGLLGAVSALTVTDVVQAETVTRTSYISFVGTSSIITENFDKPVKSVKARLVSGQADDIGYIDGVQVTDAKTPCSAVGTVVSPVDISPYVHVDGSSVWVLATATNTCMSMVGWGPATQADRAPGVIEWEVELSGCDVESPQSCECDEGDGRDVRIPRSVSWGVSEKISCPAFMGPDQFDSSFSVQASGESVSATCNNKCSEGFSVAGKGQLSIAVCGGERFDVSLEGSASDKRTHELTCSPDSCKQECNPDGYCEETTVQVSGSAARRQRLGSKFRLGTSAASVVDIECGASVALTVSGGYGETSTEAFGSVSACDTCKVRELSAGATGGAYASCKMNVNLLGYSYPIGCQDCAYVELGFTLGGKLSEGAGCSGPALCPKTTISGKAALAPQVLCVDLFGYVAKGQIGGQIYGTRTEDCNAAVYDGDYKSETGWQIETGPNASCE